ncbi:type I glyceraldehyde-3-phosphate dehydrogenase [bacterium]|nr:type I glyceraldehyde-3-phosphate dehydrogenase [candidate division CSSED10-310 bacterium]
MKTNVAINGFGRIGRLLLRVMIDHENLQIVAINDLTDIPTLAHLLKYDSSHRHFMGTVEAAEGHLIVNGNMIKVFAERDPEKLPWADLKVRFVAECTGHFRDREGAARHLNAGADRVFISAPAKNPDLTVVMGVNDVHFNPEKHRIISNASCTTNCLAPVAKVLLDRFGIDYGMMTTVHSYTNDQQLLDLPHKDLRRARAAALSMIPTTTGAAAAVGEVLPELKGKLNGLAVRVPTPNVSLVDLVAHLSSDVTVTMVNDALKEASETNLKGILGYTEEPLVSVDFNGDRRSSIVDGASTMVIGKRLVKVLSWYDNEYGYAVRLRDLIDFVSRNSK